MRTLTVSDNGMGMTKEELESNLGTIAKSGSLQFKQELGEDDKGRTSTSSASSAWASTPPLWWPTRSPSSPGPMARRRPGCGSPTGRTATPSPSARRTPPGTDIIMHIKPNADEENYDQYLETYKLQELIKKYSDYIRYPIVMEVEDYRQKEKPADAGRTTSPSGRR